MLRSLFFLLALAASATAAAAATLVATVRDARGIAVVDAVVYAVPERASPVARRTAVMDQRNRMFVPHVLPVQTGTAVQFPNSDDVRHQVYSFSPAKTFQLPLYKGTPANPIVFDQPGVATLGCNIHDRMSAYIVVVDTPHFAKSGRDGRVTIANVPAGRYTVRLWYPEMRKEPAAVPLTLDASERGEVTFTAR
jgi:plastocyanin